MAGASGRIGRARPLEADQFDLLQPEAQAVHRRMARHAIGQGVPPLPRDRLEAEGVTVEPRQPLGIGAGQAEPGDPGDDGHGTCAPRRLRKIEYSVCEPPMNRRDR